MDWLPYSFRLLTHPHRSRTSMVHKRQPVARLIRPTEMPSTWHSVPRPLSSSSNRCAAALPQTASGLTSTTGYSLQESKNAQHVVHMSCLLSFQGSFHNRYVQSHRRSDMLTANTDGMDDDAMLAAGSEIYLENSLSPSC